jgi:ATP/maltotriose-dependent transcriptional regulator MalT
MGAADALERGRAAYAGRAWAEAREQLATAHAGSPLEPADLERLAMASYLTGHDDAAIEVWEGAHRTCLEYDDTPGAARCGFWLAFVLLHRGEAARGGGWLARAQRLLDDADQDCVERGYLLFPVALHHATTGDPATAYAIFGRAAEIGGRFGDRDLVALTRHGQGRTLIMQGRTEQGISLLDETMVSVTADEVSPIIAGDIYCSVIEACQEIFDLPRAAEWTAALSDWCAAQPDLVPYRGQCLVHRSQILQLRGEWPEALDEARRAAQRMSAPTAQPALGAAHYQQAELHRLRGRLADAEDGYRRADELGRDPQPGLALLRLAQGHLDAAVAALRPTVEGTRQPGRRAQVLAAHAEILLAAGDVAAARTSADELTALAAALDAAMLHALADHTVGAVLLAEGDVQAAAVALRRAATTWAGLDAPYETARARALLARACHELGDNDTAALERGAARRAFRRLGATLDLARIDAPPAADRARGDGSLTPRELDVLRLVARGRTNREIAAALTISEHTVARHLQNVFAKLGVASRAAATAHVLEHELL